MKKVLIIICLVSLLFCSGSYSSMKNYHQRQVIRYQKKVTQAQKKINYHQQKIYYYQKKETKN